MPNLNIRRQRIILISLPPFPRVDKCNETTNETMQIRSIRLNAVVRKCILLGEQINLVTYSQVKNIMAKELTFDTKSDYHRNRIKKLKKN